MTDTRYPGGKGGQGIASLIVRHFPPHALYFEPFAGKGSVFRTKRPALRSLLIDRNPRTVEWWRNVTGLALRVRRGCGLRFMRLAARLLDSQSLIYLDPPYLHETRTKRELYGEFELSDEQHAELLDHALACRCNVAISGYDAPLYSVRLRDWTRIDYVAPTRGGPRPEVLWHNFTSTPEARIATEYSDLAGDYVKRQTVSRKVGRWVRNWLACEPVTREAILRALLDASFRQERPE